MNSRPSSTQPRNIYTCALCGGIFEKGRPDEEANQEAQEIFGVPNAANDPSMDVVCDDCWNKIRPYGDGWRG